MELEICRKVQTKHVRALTQDVLQVAVLEIFNVFVLAEEILVDVSPSEEPHIGVVGDGPVRVVVPVQSRTLSLGLHRRNQKGHAKEPQQLLVTEEHSHPACRCLKITTKCNFLEISKFALACFISLSITVHSSNGLMSEQLIVF